MRSCRFSEKLDTTLTSLQVGILANSRTCIVVAFNMSCVRCFILKSFLAFLLSLIMFSSSCASPVSCCLPCRQQHRPDRSHLQSPALVFLCSLCFTLFCCVKSGPHTCLRFILLLCFVALLMFLLPYCHVFVSVSV